MECSRIDKDNYKLWDEFIENNYSGTIFHKTKWLENTNVEFEIYVILENNKIIAGATFSYDILFGKKIYQQPAYTPYSGFVIADSILRLKNSAKYSKIKKIKREIFKNCKIKYGKIYYSPYLDIDVHVEKWNGFNNNIAHTYVLILNNINEIYNDLDKDRIKREINKAAKDDSAIIQESKDIEVVISLSKLTFQRQKKQQNNYDILRKLAKSCNNKTFIFIDKGNDTPIACEYIVYDSKRAYSLASGYDYRNSKSYATTLCCWEAIKSAFNLGLKEYDFEGTMLENVEGHIRAFGGNLMPIVSISKRLPVYYLNRVLRKCIFFN